MDPDGDCGVSVHHNKNPGSKMKILIFLAVAMAGAATLAAPAQAQNYPWCAQYGGNTGGAMNCGFSTHRQCMADISGIGGFCMRNNTYRPPGGHHVRYR